MFLLVECSLFFIINDKSYISKSFKPEGVIYHSASTYSLLGQFRGTCETVV